MDHDGASSSLAPEFYGAAEAMWQMNFRPSEYMESGPYPERPSEPHCAYYARTGVCGFGMTCRYHHPPPDGMLAVVSPARINGGYPERVGQPECQAVVSPAIIYGGYPERVGQPECQYYLQTGTCKFGATCKFHHPRDKAGIAEKVQSNILGYPLRPNEKECAYYLRTGQCKFGNTCKFDHPQPSNTMDTLRDSNVYTPVHSPAGQQSYTGGWTNWPLSRTFFSSPRCEGTPFIIPQGLFQIPGWNVFSGQLESASSFGSPQQSPGNTQSYGTSRQNDIASGAQGSFSSYQSVSVPTSQYALQRENVFPERPDQPECQFYMKTGDCKYGAVCKFHHPQERMVPIPNCVLSPTGLPLRPGDPVCSFYSQYRICKFGPNCKYDHPTATPVGGFAYSLSTSSSPDIPVVRHLQGSSPGPPALTLSSEGPTEGKPRRLSLSVSEPRKMAVSAAGDDESV